MEWELKFASWTCITLMLQTVWLKTSFEIWGIVKKSAHEHLCDVKLSVIFCLSFPTAFIQNGHSCSICKPVAGWFVISFGTGSARYSTLQVRLSSNHYVLFGQTNMHTYSWLFRTNLPEYMVKYGAPPVLIEHDSHNSTAQTNKPTKKIFC